MLCITIKRDFNLEILIKLRGSKMLSIILIVLGVIGAIAVYKQDAIYQKYKEYDNPECGKKEKIKMKIKFYFCIINIIVGVILIPVATMR